MVLRIPAFLTKLAAAGLVMATSICAIAGSLTNVSVVPADNTPGATTSYTFSYTLETQLGTFDGAALLYVNFPNDFSVNVPAGCDVSIVITVDGNPVSCTVNDSSGNLVALGVGDHLGLTGTDVPAGAEVVVVVPGVTNPAAGSYDFEATGNMPFADTGIRTVNLSGPVEIDVASIQTVTIGTPSSSSSTSSNASSSAASSSGALVDGTCGIAHTGTFAIDPPPETLCDTGTPASYSANATDYSWDCVGENGGTTANCSASLGFLITPSPTAEGTFECVPDLVAYGTGTTCTAMPSPGYDFDVWGTGDCNGVTTAACTLNNVIADPVLEALFSAVPHVITTTISPAGAGSSITCTANPVPNGGDSTCTYTAPNPGYTFANWSGACSGATCVLTNVTSAKSVRANFTAPTFSITVNTSGSGTASCTPNPVNSGSNSTCTASASLGNSFTGWTGDCNGASCTLTAVAANKTVTANFAVNTYSLSGSASPVEGGSVNCTDSVSHGSSGSCVATANAGYTFTSWSGCPDDIADTCNFTNVTANQSVTANFTVGTYEVFPSALPLDAGTVECTSPVNHGTSATCTANPNPGYRVKEWNVSDCTGNTCSISVNSDIAAISVVANFELIPTYNVSTSVSPADSGRISCTKDILEGSSATCSAIAKDGFEFTGWGGDCAGTELSCVIANVTANKSVSATFAQTQAAGFNITVGFINAVGKPEATAIAGDQICSAPNPVAGGTTVRCNVDNYRLPGGNTFRGWEGGCTKVEGRTCIIENMASDKRLTIKMGSLATDSSTSLIKVKPAGAGSVWCTQSWANLPLFSNTITDYCQAEANQGYAFEAFVKTCSGLCSQTDYYLEARFKSVPNIPVVICESCNTSTTDTFTSTTKTTSTTSTPDANGNTSQTTVATSTNTQTGDTSTTVVINQATANGQTIPGGSLIIGGTNTLIDVSAGGNTKVNIGGGSLVVDASSQGISGAFGGIAGTGATTTFSANSDKPVVSDIYNYEFTSSEDENPTFQKPITLELPVSNTSDYDSDLLSIAKIIEQRLEYYGGIYNDVGTDFKVKRNSFKPRAKSASDDYAFIGTEWSEGVNSNLEMEGTEQTTLIKNTVTLDENAPVSIQTLLTLASGNVETTLNVTSDQNSVVGNIMAGSALIKVEGVLGNFTVTDKQRPENDSRAVSLVLVNGQLDSVGLSSDQGAKILYTAMADAKAPKAIGFESSADAFSVTLSYPAAQ